MPCYVTKMVFEVGTPVGKVHPDDIWIWVVPEIPLNHPFQWDFPL